MKIMAEKYLFNGKKGSADHFTGSLASYTLAYRIYPLARRSGRLVKLRHVVDHPLTLNLRVMDIGQRLLPQIWLDWPASSFSEKDIRIFLEKLLSRRQVDD